MRYAVPAGCPQADHRRQHGVGEERSNCAVRHQKTLQSWEGGVNVNVLNLGLAAGTGEDTPRLVVSAARD